MKRTVNAQDVVARLQKTAKTNSLLKELLLDAATVILAQLASNELRKAIPAAAWIQSLVKAAHANADDRLYTTKEYQNLSTHSKGDIEPLYRVVNADEQDTALLDWLGGLLLSTGCISAGRETTGGLYLTISELNGQACPDVTVRDALDLRTALRQAKTIKDKQDDKLFDGPQENLF